MKKKAVFIDLQGTLGGVGKGDSDMLLAKNTGIRGVLVRTGGGEESLTIERNTWNVTEPYHIADNILEAANFVCS